MMCSDSKPIKVAVSGTGGGVGQSILKALSLSTLHLEVWGVDITEESAGLYRTQKREVLPNPHEDWPMWKAWVKENKIDAIFPGTDHHLVAMAHKRNEWWPFCKLLVSDFPLIRTLRDKYLTNKLLESYNIPVPWCYTSKREAYNAREWQYPVIVKPARGSRAQGMNVCMDEDEVNFWWQRTERPVIQQYLKGDEYTCSVFWHGGDVIGTFILKRQLRDGTTYMGEVVEDKKINALLVRLAACLKPRGMMNVQLRMVNGTPYVFEINCRCSGTTAIRAYYGYNEPEMMLRAEVLGQRLRHEWMNHTFGKVYRYWNEVFVNDGRGIVQAWP